MSAFSNARAVAAGCCLAFLLLAHGVVATATVITSGSMAVSTGTQDGSWQLAGQHFTANGTFNPGGLEWPENYVYPPAPTPLGTSVPMNWFSDSVDGWTGQMKLSGTWYNLAGSECCQSSSMSLLAAPIVVDGAGSFRESFAFSAALCGFISQPTMGPCGATENLSGYGTLDLVVTTVANALAPSFEIQSVTYSFGVPEPGSLGLFATGLAALALVSRPRLPILRTKSRPLTVQ
jgi:PEP-CTERM motif